MIKLINKYNKFKKVMIKISNIYIIVKSNNLS
jgi:hypothetical protein